MVVPPNPPDRYVPIDTIMSNAPENKMLAKRTYPRCIKNSMPSDVRTRNNSIDIRPRSSVRIKVRLANVTTINNTINKIVLRKLAARVFSSSSGKTGAESILRERAHSSLKSIALHHTRKNERKHINLVLIEIAHRIR